MVLGASGGDIVFKTALAGKFNFKKAGRTRLFPLFTGCITLI
jgi:hypothetical protein